MVHLGIYSQSKVWIFGNEETAIKVRKFRFVKIKMVAVSFTVVGVVRRVVLDRQELQVNSIRLTKVLRK